MLQKAEPIDMEAVAIELTISDDSRGERYTDGTLWFRAEYEPILREMSKEIMTDDGHRVPQTYQIKVLNWLYKFQDLGIGKIIVENDDEGTLLQVPFTSQDLISVGLDHRHIESNK